LTTQGLHFVSAQRGDGVPVSSSGVSSPMEPLLQLGLAVCHTLTLSTTGDLIGPAVNREAFNAILSAELLANGDVNFGGLIVKILNRFDFDHHSTTQSVIVNQGQKEKLVFVKGSAEAISKLCDPSSLPPDFEAMASQSSRNG
jgi:magnesium-transporting ATPase (P-type)